MQHYVKYTHKRKNEKIRIKTLENPPTKRSIQAPWHYQPAYDMKMLHFLSIFYFRLSDLQVQKSKQDVYNIPKSLGVEGQWIKSNEMLSPMTSHKHITRAKFNIGKTRH